MQVNHNDAAVQPDTLDDALRFASTILYNLTARRWRGECTDTYRPHSLGCSCDSDHRVLRLPANGVRSIVSVIVNGETVDPATYEIRDGRWLWKKRDADGGYVGWPCANDLTKATTEQGTFVVSYTWGQSPPAEMVLACTILAWEFALAWTPDCANKCKLPRNVTSLSRNGVTTQFPDPATLFENGKTHIAEVDMLVAAINRGEARRQPMVLIPGQASPGSRGIGSIA